jgi:hypothetical protein
LFFFCYFFRPARFGPKKPGNRVLPASCGYFSQFSVTVQNPGASGGDGTSKLPVIIPLNGASPTWVAAVDLRKNGRMDLVVAEADSGTIGVLLGNGDGTFAPEVGYYVPGAPISLAVADFDGDGNLDVVAGIVGDEFTGPLVFLKGDGQGNFGAPVYQPTTNLVGSYATAAIAVADLNGDGLPDLAIVDEGGVVDGIHSYLNEGNGVFKDAQLVAASDSGDGFEYVNVALGDMDEDGCADVVGEELSGEIWILHGNCDGSFQPITTAYPTGPGDAPAGLALADMNGDGHLDVVTSGVILGIGPPFGIEAGDLVSVLLGDGKGGLGAATVHRGEPSMYSLAVADLNGDGKPDVVTANQSTDSASVYINDGSGGPGGPLGGYVGYIVGRQQGALNAPYNNPIVRDVDGDGHADLTFMEQVQYAYTPWEFTVLLNDGTGKFGLPIRSPAVDGTLYPRGARCGCRWPQFFADDFSPDSHHVFGARRRYLLTRCHLHVRNRSDQCGITLAGVR